MICLDRAYTRRLQDKYWIFITTPSGDVARLLLSYATKEHAEQAMRLLGYRPVSPPFDNDNPTTLPPAV